MKRFITPLAASRSKRCFSKFYRDIKNILDKSLQLE